ncbi:MAG: septum formation initiator family protein [Ignavibacteria bacterium]|jgi:cell division protein FtsL
MSEEGINPTPEPAVIVERRRILNRWSVFALLFVSAGFTILYVSNVISVGKLLERKQALERSVDSLKTVNKTLETETYRLQSAERITRLAQERLHMMPPPKAPVVLEATPKR